MKQYCIIPSQPNTLQCLAQNLEMGLPTNPALSDMQVSKVVVDTTRQIWHLFIRTEKPLEEGLQASLRDTFVERCGLTAVKFTWEKSPGTDKMLSGQVQLEALWEELRIHTTKKYPALQPVLQVAEVMVKDNVLSLQVPATALRLLEQRNLSQYWEEWLCKRTQQPIQLKVAANVEVKPEETLAALPDYLAAVPVPTSVVCKSKNKENAILLGRKITQPARDISTVREEEKNVVISGVLLNVLLRELRTGRGLVTFDVADDSDGISCKVFCESVTDAKKLVNNLQEGILVMTKGTAQFDKFNNGDLVLLADSINQYTLPEKMDEAEQKRVELHLHTRMSNMDSVVSIKQLIKMAAKWGHEAVAITDHGVVQAFPEAYETARKSGVKIIYGMEGYLVEEAPDGQAYHIVLLARNSVGLRNLYRLVSLSHLQYFYRTPRIPKAVLAEMREGLLLGSACEAGELIRAIVRGEEEEKLLEIASFYDYLEVQPIQNNEFMLRKNIVPNEEGLKAINSKVCELGEKLGKRVVATGDVHFLHPQDNIYREILMAGKGFDDAEHQPPLYYRTTQEMLAEFSYLPPEKAFEIVVTNTRAICQEIEEFKPIPDLLYSPQIAGADEQVRSMAYEKAYNLYGQVLPMVVKDRLDYELKSIINHGFAVLYLIAHKLVKKSLDDGYLVGSRGSVGSSFVATMTDITEVNPLPPHWLCPQCQYSEFIMDGSVGGGFDLPDKACPHCGTSCRKEGHNIPFAVFMGFHGDKVPDIDLNFSGEYQPIAHKYTEELFGKDNVFRAGTIATIADKTAYGYVKKYFSERNQPVRDAFVNKLVAGCTGAKRTTGQHPGGIMVIPRDMDVHHFTPIQHPADDRNSSTITTHFDYHSISSRLVKLDILGHDDPTVIRMLQDITGLDPQTIPFDDPETLSLFSSTDALGLTPEVLGSKVGTFGIPEFGTGFVRQMLEDTKPTTFSELVRISGFSHGTDVWLNNAQDLIRSGTAQLSEAISARDDIMVYLMQREIDPSLAFQTMEQVRKGKGIAPDKVEELRKHNIPEWYINSCQKIKYMFPRAHAVAYVMMAVRIAWFKVHRPLAFYASYFSVRATEFDAHQIVQGPEAIKKQLAIWAQKDVKLTVKEKNMQTIMEVAYEMYLRGFTFYHVDLYRSEATRFVIDGQGLLPPFASLQGVGDTAAESIKSAREQELFLSIEDLRSRGHISRTVIDLLREHGCLEGLPEDDQVCLF